MSYVQLQDFESGDGDGSVQVSIMKPNGDKFSIRLDVNSSIEELVSFVSENCEGMPIETIRLIYGGKVLENSKMMGDYGIGDGSVIHLFPRKLVSSHPPTLVSSPLHTPDSSSSAIANEDPTGVILPPGTSLTTLTTTGHLNLGDDGVMNPIFYHPDIQRCAQV